MGLLRFAKTHTISGATISIRCQISLSLSLFIPPIQRPFLIYHSFQHTTTLVCFLLFLDFIALLALASHYLFEGLFPSRTSNCEL